VVAKNFRVERIETSKEELQSNEELMVVNHEMIGLNEQIASSEILLNPS
jgi:hypothetical protein